MSPLLLTLALGCGPNAPPAAPPFAAPSAAPAPAEELRTTGGFVDAHAHPASLGRHLSQLRLNGLGSLAETLDAVGVTAATGEGWLHGRGWDHTLWADHDGWPTAALLDAVVADRPVALRRVDGHSTWVNTAALTAAGITAETPDPEGGRILRDDTGAPTGVLVDAASDLLPKAPAPSPDERRRQMVLALDTIAATGLTGVHDMGVSDATLELYTALDGEGALPIRIFAYLDPDAQALDRLAADGPWCLDRLCVVGVKAYVDGSLGSRGALLGAPYSDEPTHQGLQITPTPELAALATRLLRARAQLAVHSIGDEGVAQTLDAFAQAREAVPEAADVPLRVEHAQVVRPADLARMKALHAVASMQPTHATSDMRWAEERLGADRVGWSYAWRDVLDAGVVLAFGSDFPVEEVAPAYGMWAATTRTDPAGRPPGGWRPDQALSAEEAVHAFTLGTWQALGRPPADGDATTWRLAPGPGDQGPWWTPVRTQVGGEEVWVEDAAAR